MGGRFAFINFCLSHDMNLLAPLLTLVREGEMRIRLGCGLLCLSIIAITINASAQSLQEQALCAKQAKIAFEEYSGDPKASGPNKITNDYESHYNPKLNRCFIAIDTTERMGQEYFTTALLMDAFERRVYASYGWMSHTGEKYWEVPPTTCELTPSTKEQTHCSSKDEYDAFVAKYMEE